MPTSSNDKYYNDYDATDNFDELEFIGDERALQSRELNVMQSMFNDRATKNATKVTGNYIISGGFSSVNSGTGVVTLSDTYAMINGRVVYIAGGTTTAITDSVAVKVGIRITETQITSSDDASLLNPAIDTQAFDTPGADRNKLVAAWGWEASTAATGGGSGTLYPLMYFYDRTFLAERKDDRMPKASVNNIIFNNMPLFFGLVYDIDLSASGVNAGLTLKVDNPAFYRTESDVLAIANLNGSIGYNNNRLNIDRLDSAIRFNGDDNELEVNESYRTFLIRRNNSDSDWNITGVNYG